ncbi:Transcription factor 21 [Oryzias melastigma]|uniref:Musculin (activated B-cell factor-1) n=1 Tax=Oryzias melastigma TaxID=30732 RepID=A0A3B3BTT5_ORYME|nr:musculin [Oryzias melastigma]KAF6722934.1 Transcription factor 21 [Oryzias melastigma]
MSTGPIATKADRRTAAPCKSPITRLTPSRHSEDATGRVGRRVKPERRTLSRALHKETRQMQRNAANARERARMRVLSKAFSRLKTSLPWVPADTKLSKLDTLRLASSYICHLRQLLQDERFESSFAHPVNLV